MSDEENTHDDLSELESAIHHLKEAQQLHDDEEYQPGHQNAAIDKVNLALDEIGEYVDSETTRLKENAPLGVFDE